VTNTNNGSQSSPTCTRAWTTSWASASWTPANPFTFSTNDASIARSISKVAMAGWVDR
jgi:hypothetical protein